MAAHSSVALSRSMTSSQFQKTMVTMVIAELSGALTAIIDAILVGQYLGGASLAAVGLATPYFSIASIVSGMLMVGCSNLCTNALGKGDMKRLSGIFSLTVGLGALIAVLLSLAGICFPRGIATLFGAKGASAEVFEKTAVYLRGLFIGAPGFILFVILTPILQLDGDDTLPKVASLVCAVTDIAGDLLNVLVFHGGMFGMSLASSVSHYAALAVVLCHFLKKGSMFRFSLRAIRIRELPALVKDGMPRVLSMAGRALLPILLNLLVIRLAGDAGVTALSTMTGTTFAVGSLGWGIGGAVLIVGGLMVGEQSVTRLKKVVDTALMDILIGVGLLAAVVVLLSPRIAALFLPEPGETRDMAVTAIRCYALCLPFLAFNVSSANYLQIVSRHAGSNLVNVGIEVAAPAALAYLLSASFGISGVWYAFPAGQALLSLIIVLRISRRDPARRGTEAHMLLREDFGVPDGDSIERSVQTMEEVVGLSAEVSGFCRSHGISPRDTYRLALCIEEMAGNVIRHGFSDGKPHHLFIRVLVKDGRIILRLCDDCALFNLKEKAELWAPDPGHPESNRGIRMIMGAAENIVYSSAMNTNNLIVTI